VGMATRIPPHNLREVIDATVAFIDDPEASVDQLCRKLRAPDFPTGGVILNSADELLDVYRTGSGTVRVRGRWAVERSGRKALAVIHEIPYGINKATLVEKIGQLVAERKIPQITDVRDESTEVVRVVLELRAPEDAPAALAYLFKHTALQSGFPVNLTCLIPPAGGGLPAPTRADLRTILTAWLAFRFRTVERRFDFELQQLRARIHILLAFAAVFDALDEAIRLIRSAEGRREAHERLVERFDFDDTQAQAVLELQLYKLAKLEINEIRAELAEKMARAEEIERILGDEAALWAVCRKELLDIRAQYGEPRRTRVGPQDDEPEVTYDEDNYIVAEDAYVIVTRDGWIKRLASFGGLEKLRVREGDSVGWVLLAATTATVCFFTDQGSAYTLRVDAVPATTGYGEPVQKHFKFADGERVVGVATSDPRGRPPTGEGEEGELGPFGVAVARNGKGSRFPLSGVLEPSTRNGRRYVKVDDPTEAVVGVQLCEGGELLLVVSRAGQALAHQRPRGPRPVRKRPACTSAAPAGRPAPPAVGDRRQRRRRGHERPRQHRIEVTLHADGRTLTVEDNGRGIPVEIHPKTPEERARGHLHGAARGRQVRRPRTTPPRAACTAWAPAWSTPSRSRPRGPRAARRQEWAQRYRRGRPKGPSRPSGPRPGHRHHGHFTPRPPDLPDTAFDPSASSARLEIKASSPGPRAWSSATRPPPTSDVDEFKPRGRLADYLQHLITERPACAATSSPSPRARRRRGIRARARSTWTEPPTRSCTPSSTASPPRRRHPRAGPGATASARRCALHRHPRAEPRGLTLTAEDIREGISAPSVYIAEPQFQGQTKDKLNNPEVRAQVDGAVRPVLEQWLTEPAPPGDAIVARVVQAARARRPPPRPPQAARNPLQRRLNLPGKLADCVELRPLRVRAVPGRGRLRRRLGQAGPRPQKQAILPLRGKVLNAEQANRPQGAQEQGAQRHRQALGCGMGADSTRTGCAITRSSC
jgi:DNA gyrase/topoisomerase IV subunit A